MTHEGRNGTHQVFTWALGIATTVILGGGGAWLSIVHGQVKEIAALQAMRGDRTSVLEAKYEVVEARLKRIEDKLDQLIGLRMPK